MTRTTGATDAQIEAAAGNAWDIGLEPDMVRFDDASDKERYSVRQDAKWWSGNLVRPDHRIVRVDDLRALVHAWLTEGRLPTETYDRIQAAIGEDE